MLLVVVYVVLQCCLFGVQHTVQQKCNVCAAKPVANALQNDSKIFLLQERFARGFASFSVFKGFIVQFYTSGKGAATYFCCRFAVANGGRCAWCFCCTDCWFCCSGAGLGLGCLRWVWRSGGVWGCGWVWWVGGSWDGGRASQPAASQPASQQARLKLKLKLQLR